MIWTATERMFYAVRQGGHRAAKEASTVVDLQSVGTDKVLLTAPPDLPEPGLTRNSRTVLERRYLHHSDTGEPLETPSGAFWRVACEVARGSEPWASADEIEALCRDYY